MTSRRIRIIGGPELGDPHDAVAIVGDGTDQLAFVEAEDHAALVRGWYPGGGEAMTGTPARLIRDLDRLLHGRIEYPASRRPRR
jgi:hypothetical protein